MELEEFKKSLAASIPPKELDNPLKAMWLEARGDWKIAHQAVQEEESRQAAWVHAHLHRKEGDPSNAQYWYARAGQDTSHLSLEEEWAHIVKSLLAETAMI